jgi:hypothetical protein
LLGQISHGQAWVGIFERSQSGLGLVFIFIVKKSRSNQAQVNFFVVLVQVCRSDRQGAWV